MSPFFPLINYFMAICPFETEQITFDAFFYAAFFFAAAFFHTAVFFYDSVGYFTLRPVILTLLPGTTEKSILNERFFED